MNKVKNIIFDVGRVILDFSHEKFFQNLDSHGVTFNRSIDSAVEELKLLEFEHGFISDKDFLEMINQKLSSPLATDAIAKCWYDIFSPVTEMVALAKKLKETHKVYLLSNTNNLHWQHIVEEYDFNSLAHGILASCEIGAMKPDPKIYKAAEKKFSLLPEEIVFIDDIERNITGAKNVGWNGIWHKDYITTKKELDQILGN